VNYLSKPSPKDIFHRRYKELYDDFTRKMMEDYFLILKDGRIVGSHPPIDILFDQHFIKFNVMGLNCDSENDAGWSSDFSPRGLDYDLYYTKDELSALMNIIPKPEHVIIALPTFMKEESSQKNKTSLLEEVIAFRPTDRVEGEDKHLLFIYAPYLIELLSEGKFSDDKLRAQKLRDHKNDTGVVERDMYNCPDDKDRDYFGGFPGGINFFAIIDDTESLHEFPESGIWKSMLMCNNCGKFYLSRNKRSDYRAGVDCPVCLITDPDEAKKSVEPCLWTHVWFRSFIPEYSLMYKKNTRTDVSQH